MLMNQAILQEVGDSHWDEILEVRCQMQEKKEIIAVIKLLFMV
jgi:hypothetical protein